MSDTSKKVSRFFANYPVKRYSKGEIIVHAGEEPPGVFFINQGLVNQYDISPDGNEAVVNVYKPEAYFPMSWAINGAPNGYFFESASNNTKLYLAPAEDTVAFVKENPDVLLDLLSRVYRGTDGLLRRVAHLMGGDAKSRLIFELLNASYRFGQKRPDDTVFVPLTESDLAQRSGLARETINRNIQSLKKEGLIEVNRKGFVLFDRNRLEMYLNSKL